MDDSLSFNQEIRATTIPKNMANTNTVTMKPKIKQTHFRWAPVIPVAYIVIQNNKINLVNIPPTGRNNHIHQLLQLLMLLQQWQQQEQQQ